MAGNKNSGRKPIPEGEIRNIDGVQKIRKNGRWKIYKPEKSSDETKKTEFQEKAAENAENNEREADTGENSEKFRPTQPEPEPGRAEEVNEDSSEDLFADLADWQQVASEAEQEEEAEPGSDELEDDLGIEALDGETLLMLLDIAGARLLWISQKFWKGKQKVSEFELSESEQKKLRKAADRAAATIKFKGAENPWTHLLIGLILIYSTKIDYAGK